MESLTYARVQDGRVVELLESDRDPAGFFNEQVTWVVVPNDQVGLGWFYNGISFLPPTPASMPSPQTTLVELQAQLAALSARINALMASESVLENQ